MSIKTWKKEFYPISAEKVKSQKKAVEHAILKWTGLLPKNREKHGLVTGSGPYYIYYYDGRVQYFFEICSDTCALCLLTVDNCRRCKITKVTGAACTKTNGPWAKWADNKDPKPMLKVLRKVLKAYK